ncbi:MAG: hypothetical protein HFE83_02865 [Lachnospiraceae bacterium]|nr:hypothetical protein [Lachnospiraceae bacterium]
MEKETEKRAETILAMLGAVRRERPLVHMIPNQVTAAFCADAIGAVGGRPLMAQAPEEMEEITGQAFGLAVNMGQPGREKEQACRLAMETAAGNGLYTVFDPVGAGASSYRLAMAKRLLAIPWAGVVKGNGAELHALFDGALSHTGVDSQGQYENEKAAGIFLKHVADAGRTLAAAETGETDRIFWFDRGSRRMRRLLLEGKARREQTIVGTGCVAGAILGAILAAMRAEGQRGKDGGGLGPQTDRTALPQEEQFALAAAGAVSLVSFCGERGPGKTGYGSGKTAFLDRLSRPDETAYRRYLETHIREEW